MKSLKLLFLFSLLMVGLIPSVKAENSATAYDRGYYSEQVFVQMYNNSGFTVPRDNVVVNDVSVAVNPNQNLGQFFTRTQTTDSVFIVGVTDESILDGTLGRICVRGPHKAVSIPITGTTSGYITSGAIITASSTLGTFGFGATADGTSTAKLGYIMKTTATTDTGDASNTYWIWVNPSLHK